MSLFYSPLVVLFTVTVRRYRRWLVGKGSILAAALALVLAAAPTPLATDHLASECVDNSDPTRTTPVEGDVFMVAAANPLAVQAGCDVLASGGSVMDAAVAVQMVLAVVEPQSSGLAGGTLITYWDRENGEVRFFEGLSRAPRAVTDGLRTPTEEEKARLGIDEFENEVAVTGRAFGVPGTVAVLEMAHEIYREMAWSDLFDDAIELAENGFPMPEYLHTVLGESTRGLDRCEYPDLAARYCDGATPKTSGTMIFNPELADTLSYVRDGGADAFYDPEGPIAPVIIDRITEGGFKLKNDEEGPAVIPSLMTADDFADYEATERDPVCNVVIKHLICSSAPPAFGGVTVLYMLELMERGKVKQLEPNSLPQFHLAIESSRLAQVDRRQYIGDPDFNKIPASGLLDEDYLDTRFELFSPHLAIHPIVPGEPPPGDDVFFGEDADATSHVTIVDANGDALSMTTSVNSSFGTQMEAGGMILNNVQQNFTRLDSISPGKPVNVMESMKRPRTSMAPTLVFDRNGKRLRLAVGAAGGGAIPDYVTQIILGVITYKMDPQAAINQGHFSGQTITSNCAGIIGARSELESGTGVAALLDGLKTDLQHPCARTTSLLSGLTAIQVEQNGTLLGAADPRRDGIAMGR